MPRSSSRSRAPSETPGVSGAGLMPGVKRHRDVLETVTLVHLGAMLLFAPWALGGNIWWARIILSWWGGLGVLITFAAIRRGGVGHRLWWLVPWLLFIGLVLLSCLNPSFSTVIYEGQSLSVHQGAPRPGWPSTANVTKTLHELWFSAGAYLAAFNLMLTVRHRRALRALLIVVGCNALVLSVFGTLQKLSGAGLFFGAVEPPNARFFSTFIYYNHWGAYMVLAASACFGLLFHYERRMRGRNFWHSPATSALLGTLLIIATAPVSASRAATAMGALLIVVATAQGLARVIRSRRAQGESAAPAVLAVLVPVVIAVAAMSWLAARSIRERVQDTKAQLADGREGVLKGREELYRDTWQLALRKPAFGWGLESYGITFQLMRPRPVQTSRQYEASYVEAHSDWLQSVAETGFVGTSLVVAMAGVPAVATLRRRRPRGSLVAYPLLGCGLVALYAWVEFPFANAAVLITFWTWLFIALRHTQLQDREDEADA